MATRPSIEILFRQLATTLITRSERGTAILLLNDSTKEELRVNEYKNVAEVNEDDYSADNLKHIKSCMSFAPYEIVVIANNSSTFADFAKAVTIARPAGWIGSPVEEMQDDIASWIKSEEKANHSYKGIGTHKSNDCKHYVYFNQDCFGIDGTEITAVNYIPSLLGLLASCNVEKGCTNYLLPDLNLVDEVEDIDAAIKEGQFVLTNDIGGVRVVTGINSLTSLDGNTATEDMQYIETVETMDMIRDDIRDVFKNTYQGRFKNKYKNQALFIGAVCAYFDALAFEDILDEEFTNIAEIDIAEQRAAWIGSGNTEAAGWDDDTVKRRSYKRSVFVAANIKITNCMENLKFGITLE